MTRVGDVFGGNYLKAEDLAGREVSVTIEGWKVVELGEGETKQKKVVLSFAGKDKTLVCNVTNARMIEELLGTDEMDDWEGQRIRLYVAKVDFQGKRVSAIRVKAASNGKPAPKVEPEPDPDMTEDLEDAPF